MRYSDTDMITESNTCRNKVKAIKERTHRILYWFGVTLHPIPHTSTDFLSKAIFTITHSISRLWTYPPESQSSGQRYLISQATSSPNWFPRLQSYLLHLIDFQGYNHTFSRLVDYKKPITLNSTEDLVEMVIENQNRDNLIRFNVDFAIVMIRICI